MKKLIALFVFVTMILPAFAKTDWKGKVVDENGEPVPYANVAVLSKADSAVVCGAVTADDGTFNIVTSESDGIMMVAMMGYRTVYLSPLDGAVITLAADKTLLEGATILAIMPKTKLTGEGLQTTVRGSVLEKAGTAKDVLSKTPGMIKGQNGLEVIGKGAPLVYINGRRVTDSSELDRLQSNEIQSVEVITNPGVQYDASVGSVVRIRTIRRQGDGFGFDLYVQDDQSLRWDKGNDPIGALNVNYRTGGVDVFGGINYARNTSRQQSELEKKTFGKTFLLENKGDLLNNYIGQSLYGTAGVNWQIADNHFMGGKIDWGKTLQNDVYSEVNDNVWLDGALADKLATISNDKMGDGGIYNLGANLYYNGVIGSKLGVDVNLDYYGTNNASNSQSKETSDISAGRTIRSGSQSDGRMYAAKAVLSYPVWKGQLQAGTEEVFSRRSDNYSISGIDIPASQASVVEDSYAGFVNYGFFLERAGQFSAGVRYEYVHYAYRDAITPANDIIRNYSNWFPMLSWATVIDPNNAKVQLMVNYNAKTLRPNYAYLSGTVRYNSRYIWQSGNAQLQPELRHNFSLTALWKFISLVVNYSRVEDAIMTWSSPVGDEGVVLVQPRNIETPLRKMAVYMTLTPTIGPWAMNYTLGVLPQWLTINAPDFREPDGIRVTRFSDKPIGIAQLFNTFTISGGWQLEVGGTVWSPGYNQNMYMKNWYCDLSTAVQKSLLNDGSLVLRLEGNDLLGTAHFDAYSDFGSHTISQTNLMDTQRVKLSLRYNFNTAQSKYRGRGAGSDNRERM